MNHPVSIKGVLLLDGRVVLVKNPRDEWELPGGRVDAGEAHAQTLSREFAEELAINVCVGEAIERLAEINLPAGYRRSVEKWAERPH